MRLDPVVVRPMTVNDIAATAAVWHAAWHDAHAALVDEDVVLSRTRDTFLSCLPQMVDDSYVLVHDGVISGFGALAGDMIDQIYVARECRGKGVASDLLAVLEEALRIRGVDEASLTCAIGNTRAERFYKKNGWTYHGPHLVERGWPDGQVRWIETGRFTKRLGP